jgi:DNA-directed RNA polymerase beta subunit
VKAFIDEKRTCYFSLPYIKTNLPAGLVFKALSVDDDPLSIDDIVSWIRCHNKNFIKILVEQFDEYDTSRDAIEEIARRLPECEGDPLEYVTSILNNELFYHIGTLTPRKSAMHLAYILKRLLAVATGSMKCDEKHNLSNKRIQTSGPLVSFIFNGLFKQFVKSLSNQNKISTV